jgi:hypothetical protein
MPIHRKGIFQEIDPNGNVVSDERWQALTLPDGNLYIENETVRVAPFDEPRSDSMTVLLDNNLRLIEFSIHGLFAKRESRICILGDERKEATICWRREGDVREKRIAWRDDYEIDWNTPLLNMLTVWRSKLSAGQSRTFDCWFLGAVSFEPSRMKQVYANLGKESHTTNFGELALWHYTLDFGADGTHISHLWFDDEGVLFDFAASGGGRFVLRATDLEM